MTCIIEETFYQVFKMKANTTMDGIGSGTMHGNVNWKLGLRRNEGIPTLALYCMKEKRDEEFKIKVEATISINNVQYSDTYYTFGTRQPFSLWLASLNDWSSLSEVNVRVGLRIIESKGIKKHFNNYGMRLSADLILDVGGNTFFLDKRDFKFQSSWLTEKVKDLGIMIKVTKDFNACSFHNYVDMLYGHDALTDDTVTGILEIAYSLRAHKVLRKCEKFLIEKSKFLVQRKKKLAGQYLLDKVKAYIDNLPVEAPNPNAIVIDLD